MNILAFVVVPTASNAFLTMSGLLLSAFHEHYNMSGVYYCLFINLLCMSVKVLEIGSEVFKSKFGGKDQLMVTLSGGYDFILRREVKTNTFVPVEHIGNYVADSVIPGVRIAVLPIAQSFIGRDGSEINLSTTNVLARETESDELCMERVLAAKAWATSPEAIERNEKRAKSLRAAELQNKGAKATADEKKELAELLAN